MVDAIGKQIVERLSYKVIGCAFEVHSELGPGMLESVYEEALVIELKSQGFDVKRQQQVPVYYKGQKLSTDLRYDLLVNDELLIELKSVEAILPVHCKQLLTYLKVLKLRDGLLINFNVEKLTQGIKKIANGY